MILSRVWYLLLAIAAVMGFAFAMVSVRLIDAQSEEAVRDDLRRDRTELEQLLRLDARTRIDAIAPLAAQGDVRSALRDANRRGTSELDPAIVQRLTARLTELNRQLEGMAGDIVFAVDANGIIVAQVGGPPPPRGAGLGGFPLVRRALDGYLRDDVWVYHDAVYRMAARPVIDGGQYVGALVHGKRMDADFAGRLSSRLAGASIGFFYRDRVVASAMADQASLPPGLSAPRQDDMAGPLAQVLGTEEMQGGERTDPMALPTGGLAIYSPVIGAASHAQVGYVIARPVPTAGSPLAIFSLPSAQDWSELANSSVGMATAGGGLLAFIIGLLFVWIERDRPLARFRDTTARLAKKEVDKLIPLEFGGPLRMAAAHINDALEKAQASAGTSPKRRAADLDEILGPVPDRESAPAFFGFGGGSADPVKGETQAAAPASAAVAAPPPAAPPAPPAVAAPKPPPPAKPAAPPKPPGQGLTPAPVQRPAPVADAPVADAPVAAAPAPSPAAPPSSSSSESNVLASEEQDLDGDGPTMVAHVPEALLAKLTKGGGEAEQEKHFRDVFEEFVALKKQCNEPVTGLTFEKFVVTLRKNRDQIVQKHGAAKVRFTVYVKEGKAALKATPIRDQPGA